MSFIKFDEEIEGKRFFVISENDWWKVDHGVQASFDEGYTEVFLFEDEEAAGKHVREYWADMVEHDSEEAVEMLGSDNLIQWALGKLAGPGTTQVRSLSEWLDLHLDVPEEHFENGPCCIEAIGENLIDEFGFKPTVAYTR